MIFLFICKQNNSYYYQYTEEKLDIKSNTTVCQCCAF